MHALMIGTLFEQEEVDKKKHFYNIAARDEKGRKWFHGAFTGGRSAGYKGTVGSKEGWTPSQFVSSRSQRFQGGKQSITDYMDEEDIGATIAGETITARQEYDTLGEKDKKLLQQSLGTSILGAAPEELIVPSKTSVGYEIIKNMGGVQKAIKTKEPKKKVYGVSGPSRFESKEEKIEFFGKERDFPTEMPQPKNDFKGLNYKEIADYDEEDADYEKIFNKVFKKHAGIDQTEEEEEQKKKSKRISFNITDIEGDEDFGDYEKGQMSRVVMESTDELDDQLLSKAKFKKASKELLQDFQKEQVPLKISTKNFVNDEVPADWDPYARVKGFLKKERKIDQALERKYNVMNPDKRAEMLGEEVPQRATEERYELKERLSRISEDTRKKIVEVKSFVRAKDQEMGGTDLNLMFKGDKDKIERYKMFVWEKNGKLVSGIPPGNMSFADLKKEKEEFEQIYQMFHRESTGQDLTAETPMTEEQKKQAELLEKIKDLEAKIKKDQTRRKVEYWLPDKILCRRFNVPQPKVHEFVERQEQERKVDKFHEKILPAFLQNKEQQIPMAIPKKVEEVKLIESSMPTEFTSKYAREQALASTQAQEEEEEGEEGEISEEEIIEEKKPSMDLFKSIFDEESDTE